jgi:hypothetical protein
MEFAMPWVERDTAWRREAKRYIAAPLMLMTVLLLSRPTLGQSLTSFSLERTLDREPIAIIVHPENPLTNISLQDLRAIFLRLTTRWPENKIIVLINWAALSQTRVAFDREVLKMSPDEVSAFWIDCRIRGLGAPPRSLTAPQLILAIVARIKESVSYLPLKLVNNKVKVLRVDGMLPGDPRYTILLGRAKP